MLTFLKRLFPSVITSVKVPVLAEPWMKVLSLSVGQVQQNKCWVVVVVLFFCVCLNPPEPAKTAACPVC